MIWLLFSSVILFICDATSKPTTKPFIPDTIELIQINSSNSQFYVNHNLAQQTNYSLFILPQHVHISPESYASIPSKRYDPMTTHRHNVMMSILNSIIPIRETWTTYPYNVMDNLEYALKALNPEAALHVQRSLKVINLCPEARAPFLSHVSHYIEIGLRFAIQNQIELIQHIVSNTTYGTSGKIPRKYIIEFNRKKQHLNNTLQDIASVVLVSLKAHQLNISLEDIGDIDIGKNGSAKMIASRTGRYWSTTTMISAKMDRITSYWKDLYHLKHSLQIALIVDELNSARTYKQHTRAIIGIILPDIIDINLTADLLRHLGCHVEISYTG
eukprot:205204_1